MAFSLSTLLLSLALSSLSLAAPNNVCTSSTCRELAKNLRDSMDTTVSPCQDFRSYAAGNYLKTAKEGDSSWDSASENRVETIEFVLTTANVTKSVAKGDRQNLYNIGSYWDQCNDAARRNAQGIKHAMDMAEETVSLFRGSRVVDSTPWSSKMPLDKWMSTKAAQPAVTPTKENRKARLTEALIYLHARQIPALFGIGFGFDSIKHPEQVLPATSQISFHAAVSGTDSEVKRVYPIAIGATLKLTYETLFPDQDHHDYAQLAAQVVKLETFLNSRTLRGNPDPIANFLKLTFDAASLRVNQVDWKRYIRSFSQTRRQPTSFLYQYSDYMDSIDEALDVDDSVIEAYLLNVLLQHVALDSAPSSKLSGFWQSMSRVNYTTSSTDFNVACMNSAIERIPNLIGHYYLKASYSEEVKQYTESVLSSIVVSFQKRLPDIPWLDNVTRKIAHAKAAAIKWLVGYPLVPLATDAQAVAQAYKRQEPFDQSHSSNAIKAAKGQMLTNWSLIGRKVMDVFYGTSILTFNAEYVPEVNRVNIFAPIQKAPLLYDLGSPDYLQFGSIGAVAAHEVTHGFDTTGRLYDGRGALVNWWSSSSEKAFNERAQCVIDQFNGYCLPDGTCVNGEMDSGEIIADLGGVNIAFAAWQERRSTAKFNNGLLPDIDLTPEQLFYVAYAYMWTSKDSEAYIRQKMLTDVHPPNQYRILGTLVNSEGFAKAFNCPLGSPMNPVKKCSIW